MQYLGTSSNVVSGGISNVNRENFPTRFQYSANKQYTRIVWLTKMEIFHLKVSPYFLIFFFACSRTWRA